MPLLPSLLNYRAKNKKRKEKKRLPGFKEGVSWARDFESSSAPSSRHSASSASSTLHLHLPWRLSQCALPRKKYRLFLNLLYISLSLVVHVFSDRQSSYPTCAAPSAYRFQPPTMRMPTMQMPWSKANKLDISALGEELQNLMVQSNSDPKASLFVPRGKLKEFWDDARLKAFADKHNAFKPDHIKRIKGSYLQTLSILVVIQWNEWSRFQTLFLETENRSDENIPGYHVDMLMAPTFLGKSGFSFSIHRRVYCPIDIEEGKHRELDEGWILPVIKREVIGNGGAGTVTKEHVYPEHLCYNDGRSVS